MSVFRLYYNQIQSESNIEMIGKIDVFTTGIAPFKITSMSIHEDLPIIFLGLEGHGVLAVHALTL